MASSMAAAAAHSMPPFPLPAVPRVRPPPIPKGTPGPNTLPQPGLPGGRRGELVWADGRWASPHSRSALQKRDVVSRQLEKALQHEVHGMNIYAYKHIRTRQVVYSLTKNMDNTKILKQLLFHGKKTVPAALRRDVWRPHFSVHFPKTPAGAQKGLCVFQELRELSALRQLKPPKEMVTATHQDLHNIRKQFDPDEWRTRMESIEIHKAFPELPIPGERLPQKTVAKRLMNQEATSVADIAAILTRQTNAEGWKIAQASRKDRIVSATGPTPQQRMDEIAERRQAKGEVLSIRANNRLAEIRRKEEAKAKQIEERQQYLQEKPGMVKLDRHTRDRINIEYDGIEKRLDIIEEADEATRAEIGATVALQQALKDIEEEKRAQRQEIEKDMGAQIEQRLMKMTETERNQIEKEVEIERAQKQSEIDAQVAAIREKYKEQRAELYELPASAERARAIRKLTRENQAEMHNMKTNLRTQHLKWVGPFASIATEVDKAMSAIDARWEPQLVQLRKQVANEKEQHADLNHHEVEIRWANIRDGTYAKSWPDTVYHVDLQPKAVTKKQERVVTTHSHYDAEEDLIETQWGLTDSTQRSTVHVFGSASPAEGNTNAKGRYESPSEYLARKLDSRNMRVQEWTNTEAIIIRERIVAMRTQCNELERQFTGTRVDPDLTPEINNMMSAVKTARRIVDEQMTLESYSPSDLKEMNDQIQYIRDLHSFCLDELPESRNPVADKARIEFAKLEADILVLESQNHEARQQATTRLNFFTKLNERERLEREIKLFEVDETKHAAAMRNLETFDFANPVIANIFTRREAALENLPSEIATGEAEIARLTKELDLARKDKRQELRQELKTQQQQVSSKTAELEKLRQEQAGGRDAIWKAARKDKQAWLEFKREKGFDEYFVSDDAPVASTQAAQSSGNVAAEKKMVMEQPDEMKGPIGKSKDQMGRGVRFFGLGRFFGR